MPASLELVKIALQAYANGDCEIALALSGPQVRWDERASRSDGDLVWGQDKVQRAMRRYLDSWEDYRFDVEDLAEVGPGKVVGICRERGKPKDGPGGRSPVRRALDRRGGQDHCLGDLPDAEGGGPRRKGAARRPRRARPGQAIHRTGGGQAPPEPAPAPAQPAPEPIEAAEPIEARSRAPEPQAERPRKRALTKSEEQKRAARARARLRKQSSRQSA